MFEISLQNSFQILIRRLWAEPRSLTLHVIGLERVANFQHAGAQQHIRLERLVAPHTEHQLAEGGHDPAGGWGKDRGKGELGHGIRPEHNFFLLLKATTEEQMQLIIA